MKPKVIEHLISIGFKEIIGEWRPVWGQGDGEYWHGKLVRDTDIVYTDRNTTFFKYSYNGIITNEEFLMALKKETTMKTAVEWLEDLYYPNYIPKEIFEQAKEMEKQQIIDAYRNGRSDQQSSRESIFYSRMSEQYYNETFKK